MKLPQSKSVVIHVPNADLTRRARFIFGEFVETAFFSYEAKEDYPDICKGIDIAHHAQQLEDMQPNTLHEIAMQTAGEVVILFANGKAVSFSTSEWGHISCQPKLNPPPEP